MISDIVTTMKKLRDVHRFPQCEHILMASVKVPVIVLEFPFDNPLHVIPIELKANATELGWLYTVTQTGYVAIDAKGHELKLMKLQDFKAKVEGWCKSSGKQFTTDPSGEAMKLYRSENNAVNFFVSKSMFFNNNQ